MIARHDLALVMLVDVQILNGTVYYWSTWGGSFPHVLGAAGSGDYQPWVKTVGPFRLTRSLRADAGDLLLQNVSGNSIDRDVGRAFRNGEFEGALVVVRAWDLRDRNARWEFHGTLTAGYATEIEAGGRLLQLLDMNNLDALRIYSEQCVWRYKSAECGSAGDAVSCAKSLDACLDPSRNAIERFGGVPTPPPIDVNTIVQIPNTGQYRGARATTLPYTQTTRMQISQAQLGIGRPLAWGYVRARGNLLLQQQYNDATFGDKTTLSIIALGEGEWAGCDRLWINSELAWANGQSLSDGVIFHFHAGTDGTLGSGLAAVSTGPDQGVDALWADFPEQIPRLTFSRLAYIVIKAKADPDAPTSQFDWLGDYRALKVRMFDATGEQTGYGFSSNGCEQVMDALLRLRTKPEQSINEGLVAAERARFDFPSYADCVAWLNETVNGGKRSESSCAFPQQTTGTALVEQLLAISNIYLCERRGKVLFYPDGQRASVFTLIGAHAVESPLRLDKRSLPDANNRLLGHFNDLNLPVMAEIADPNGITRAGGTVTVITKKPHGLKVNDGIEVWDVPVASFNGGPFKVTAVVDADPLARTGWVATASSSAGGLGPQNILDGNTATFWRAGATAMPQWLAIDMGGPILIGMVGYRPGPLVAAHSVTVYEIYLSNDGVNWGTPVAAGGWAADSTLKTAHFPAQTRRYMKLNILGVPGVLGNAIAEASEVYVYPASASIAYAQAGADETSGGGNIGMSEQRYLAQSPISDHEQHQLAVGQRGAGLATMPVHRDVDIDYGNNTADRVARLMYFTKVRQLGLDQQPYLAPREVDLKAFLDSEDVTGKALLDVVNGQMVTIDRSVQEEMAGEYELLEATFDFGAEGQDGTTPPTIELYLKEKVEEAYDDTVP